MKKVFAGLVFGFAAGAIAVWIFTRHPEEKAAEKKPTETGKHEAGLHLKKEQQEMAGIKVGKPEAVEQKPEMRAFGRVLDSGPLAAVIAEIESAKAAVEASEKEFERLKSLKENIATRSLEAAEAAMKRDRVTLESAQARLLATWGKPLTSRADLAALAKLLVNQEAALVRVDLPAGETMAAFPKGLRIAAVAGEAEFRDAELIGPAPNADSQAQGQAFFALAREHPPSPGTSLTARLAGEGEARKGFRLPRAAVIQHDGELYVYVQTGDEVFEKKQVEVAESSMDGVFIVEGLKGEEKVVLNGAQQLLSEEQKAAGGAE